MSPYTLDKGNTAASKTAAKANRSQPARKLAWRFLKNTGRNLPRPQKKITTPQPTIQANAAASIGVINRL